MAERMVYGGTNMEILLQSGGISREAIADLLASGAASNYHGLRTMVSFEDAYGGAPEYSFYQQEETGDDDTDACFHQPGKKRRLTTDQIHLLEKSFEVENKLEPDRKIQLAKDLGLQPRQVAVWFQNRRARWKTKQLEQDYKTLKSSYSNLKGNYDDLLKEKEKLKAEVAVLTEKLLLEKKEEKNFETHKLEDHILHQQTVKPGPDSRTEMEEMHAPPLAPAKLEVISPSNSIVFDSESPHHSDGRRCSPLLEPVASSNALEQDYNSDLSHREEDEEGGIRHYARLEDSTCGYGLPLDDHSFWFWPSFSDVSLPHLPSDGPAQDDSQRCFCVVRGK